MRSETEIREHLEVLRRSNAAPCNCPNEGHLAACYIGGSLMKCAADVLAWVVNDPTHYGTIVAKLEEMDRWETIEK